MNENILELDNISKKFGNVHALKNVSFSVKKGKVTALLGENGAGKSTILNIMSGALAPDKGNVRYDGANVHFTSTHMAIKKGIVKVHQELQLIPELSVAENIFLGEELYKNKTHILDFKRMREITNNLMQQLNANIDANDIVGKLSVAQQQLVEIAKALLHDFSLLILDEPTSSLTSIEIETLFATVRKLVKDGRSVIFVTHRMDEVFEISDDIIILRDGMFVAQKSSKDITNDELILLMTGRNIVPTKNKDIDYHEAEIVMSVRDFATIDGKCSNINFDLYKGEILGIAGLVGSGRTEIIRAIFGADKKKNGKLFLQGKEVKINKTKTSVKYGMALIPEDRKGEGFANNLSNGENINLSSYDQFSNCLFVKLKGLKNNANKFMEVLKVSPSDVNMKTVNLSGGNQQKVVIAKWLSTQAKIIFMDEPTRGIDIGAKEEIYKLMHELTEKGISIVMISSELPEILHMSNRILVMYEGHLVAELLNKNVTETEVLDYAMGIKKSEVMVQKIGEVKENE